MSRRYLNEELLHWTGRKKSDDQAFSILQNIVDEKILRLTYCPNYVNPEYKPESVMVCFTDIPLRHSREHCSKFGKFGISFNKQKMIDYGANPVFYTTGKHFNRIRCIANLLARMLELEKDRKWKEEEEPYRFEENETVALKESLEFLQEYSHKNKDDSAYVTYYQREWRLTFNSLPFAGGSKSHDPGSAGFYCQGGEYHRGFKFCSSDVEYLVVPLCYIFKGWMLAQKLGCKLKIYGFSVGR